jgi:hypothetical protein
MRSIPKRPIAFGLCVNSSWVWGKTKRHDRCDSGGKLLLHIANDARRGPGRRDHLSQVEIELIARKTEWSRYGECEISKTISITGIQQ